MSNTLKPIRLPNGLQVVIEQRPGTELAQMSLFIRCGNMDDPKGFEGISCVLGDILLWGSSSHSKQALKNLADQGSKLHAYTNEDFTMFYAASHPSNLPHTLAVLADLLQNPLMPADGLAFEKQRTAESLAVIQEDPDENADILALQAAFQNQATGRIPDEDSLDRITPDAIKAHHAAFYVAENMVLSIVGDIDPNEIMATIAKHFARIPDRTPPQRATPVHTPGDVRVPTDHEKTQIRMYFEGVPVHDPDRPAAELLYFILSGSMIARLMHEIRDKRGLVYGIHAHHASLPHGNLFKISASTDSKEKNGVRNSTTLIPVLCQTLLGTTNSITQDELATAQKTMQQYYAMQRMDSEKTCQSLGRSLLNQGSIFSTQESLAIYNAITVDDIHRVARRIFSGKPTFFATGPLEGLPAPQDITAMMKDMPPAPVAAMTARTAPKAPKPEAKTVQPNIYIPHIRSTSLDNGLRIVVDERPGCGILKAGFWVRCGSGYERAEIAGISHFIEHMVFKGTKKYSLEAISMIEAYGGNFNAYTSHDMTAYHSSAFPEQFAEVVDILADMVFDPTFTEHLETERGAIQEEILDDVNNAEAQLINAVFNAAFASQPLGWPILGTRDIVSRITTEQLKAYHHACYTPSNTILVVAGDITLEKVVQEITPRMANKPASPRPMPAPARHTGGQTRHIPMQSQLHQLMLSFPVSDVHDPDHNTCNVFLSILDTRLTHTLENERQLPGSINMWNMLYDMGGHLVIQMTTHPQFAPDVFTTLMDVCRDMQQDISQEDLETAKNKLRLDTLILREQPDKMCDHIGRTSVFSDRINDINETLADYARTTPQDVMRVARRIFSGLPSWALIGDATAMPSPQDIQTLLKPKKDAPSSPGTKPTLKCTP